MSRIFPLNFRNVDVIDCTLLTRREDASFLTFKVTVKHGNDADRIQDPQFWPDGMRTRLYKPPTPKRNPGDKQTKNTTGNTNVAHNNPVTRKQANDTDRDSGNAGAAQDHSVSNNGIPISMFHQNPYNYPSTINDWNLLHNHGMIYPQNVTGGFVPVGNLMREKC